MSDEQRSRRCENCRFAEAVPSVLTFVSYNDPGWGQCRRRPPVLRDIGDHQMSVFPAIRADDWCGEHETSRTSAAYVSWGSAQGPQQHRS